MHATLTRKPTLEKGAQGQRAEDQRDICSTTVDSIQQQRIVMSILAHAAGGCQHSITMC